MKQEYTNNATRNPIPWKVKPPIMMSILYLGSNTVASVAALAPMTNKG